MLGNTLALLCALVWSLAVICLKISGTRLHPLIFNLFKNGVGLVLLALSAWIIEGHVHWPSDKGDLFWILLIGFLGIGVADGLVLRAMKSLKASHIAVLECLFAPFVILLSMVLLDERPTLTMLVGGAMIIGALFCIPPSGEDDADTSISVKERSRGILLMSLGLFLIAYGIIIIKPLFDSVPLFSLVTLRMLAGFIGSLLFVATVKHKRTHIRDLLQTPRKGLLFWAAFLSSYLSIILWVAGYKYLQATVAALLNQTSTLFTVLFAILFLKERLSRRKILAICLSVAGVILITVAP
jgi:drug/metabolite transporter (DMT)-like permease